MASLTRTRLLRPSLLTQAPQTTPPTHHRQAYRPSISGQQHTQIRHATYVPRPRRPYTFTQLVQLSDGSTYTVRSTSPVPLVRSAKDTRNHALWQPSDKSLKNVEVDEAGKLAAFRERFGRGFDLAAEPVEGDEAGAEAGAAAADAKQPAQEENPYDLGDLISEYAASNPDDQARMKDGRGKGKK
ncbi:54S ribosomal protein L36 [Colletotrichum sidae]|uniref:54S ribosomal protein L36 n=2 Tax=Colletotrichum orbiculare species complex TaxID=2707354 RepID=A0A4R8RD24_COLTR|nr:54S ribosomal protein L36 [Colletotrichum trifolii]TEA14238.1 54S ribosomal protein L36 [Colletotrichum sidae]